VKETRELDRRVADGLEVRLLWHLRHDRAVVAVADSETGESFVIEVGSHQSALDVFHHPFVPPA
jgi:hypothetical protein